ncbi:hypothetical protein CFB89_14510 [Burkholderia sp. AU16741]|nr:hypothetical protein [Burkholderia sp. AU45388]OXI32336.1 hypothetical protein CFB89_14510 [Burkholderia sp. AU16741]
MVARDDLGVFFERYQLLTQVIPDAGKNDGGGELDRYSMSIKLSLKADSQLAESGKPCVCAIDHLQ